MDGMGWMDGTYEDRILRAQNGAQEGRCAGFVRPFDTGGLLFVCRSAFVTTTTMTTTAVAALYFLFYFTYSVCGLFDSFSSFLRSRMIPYSFYCPCKIAVNNR